MRRLFFIIFLLLSFVTILANESQKTSSSNFYLKQIHGNSLLFDIHDDIDLILHKEGFSIGYSNKYRQAIWVCYVLFADNLKAKQAIRSNNFKPDKEVENPVKPQDYSQTGYDRGHLAPAADMTYSIKSMEASFLMSNISPQIPGCNRGIWRRIENQIREWAMTEDILYIITGPVFDDKDNNKLGKTDLPIPVAFYKIVFDMTPPCKMIGFIVPNQTTKRRVASFVVSVDEIEELIDVDFFTALPDADEKILEAQKDFNLWHNMEKK